MREGYSDLFVCVYLFVTTLAATSFSKKIRYERLLHDMQNKRDMWILLKCSVEKLFAYHSDP